jgi:hypothetical protein
MVAEPHWYHALSHPHEHKTLAAPADSASPFPSGTLQSTGQCGSAITTGAAFEAGSYSQHSGSLTRASAERPVVTTSIPVVARLSDRNRANPGRWN